MIYLYKCPDCGIEMQASQVAHQHANGEWIPTSALISYFKSLEWSGKTYRESDDTP